MPSTVRLSETDLLTVILRREGPKSRLAACTRPSIPAWHTILQTGYSPIASEMLMRYMHVMASRTGLMLDAETRQAARRPALRDGGSTSEAIRRGVRGHRDITLAVPAESRTERRKVLGRLFQLFEGNDAEEEISRLKAQDSGF